MRIIYVSWLFEKKIKIKKCPKGGPRCLTISLFIGPAAILLFEFSKLHQYNDTCAMCVIVCYSLAFREQNKIENRKAIFARQILNTQTEGMESMNPQNPLCPSCAASTYISVCFLRRSSSSSLTNCFFSFSGFF